MAVFSNQATLTYNGTSTNSNIAYGEILDVLAVTKTAVDSTYTLGDIITYVVTLRNTGTTALTGITVTDDLGGYLFNTATVYPLTYEDGSATLFIDGTPQPAPTVTAGPPLTVTGLTVPAGGNTVLVYQARVNAFASPAADGTIINTATVTGDGIGTPLTATAAVTATTVATLTITKSISPTQVVDNDRVTYTFVIQNTGNEAIVTTDDATISDTFDPRLVDLAVTFEGVTWTEGVQYTYSEASGLFTTLPGAITVPAATYTQDPVTGEYTTTPGTATLTVIGTI